MCAKCGAGECVLTLWGGRSEAGRAASCPAPWGVAVALGTQGVPEGAEEEAGHACGETRPFTLNISFHFFLLRVSIHIFPLNNYILNYTLTFLNYVYVFYKCI